MNCPYCGSPMEDGIVLGRTGVGLPWLPRGKDDNSFSVLRPIEKTVEKCGGLFLGTDNDEHGPYNCFRLSVAICKSCRKGVADLTSCLPELPAEERNS